MTRSTMQLSELAIPLEANQSTLTDRDIVRARIRLWTREFTMAFWVECAVAIALMTILRLQAGNILHTKSDDPRTSSDQLAWYSAILAVAVIALTAMAGSSSKVNGCPEELSFYLKVNPFVCLANTTATVLALTVSKRSPFDKTLLRLAEEKFGGGDFQHLGHRPTRLALFVLGSVPQAIKLYACRGILLTQFIVSCYLLDFIHDELILLYACVKARHRLPVSHKATVNHGQDFKTNPAFLGHDWLLSAYTINTYWSATSLFLIVRYNEFVKSALLVSIGYFSLGLCKSVFGRCIPMPELPERIQREYSCLSWILKAVLAFIGSLVLDLPIGLAQKILISSCTVILVVSMTFERRVTRMDSEYIAHFPERFPRLASSSLVLFNLLTYYTTCYDMTHTFRPEWVKWLG